MGPFPHIKCSLGTGCHVETVQSHCVESTPKFLVGLARIFLTVQLISRTGRGWKAQLPKLRLLTFSPRTAIKRYPDLTAIFYSRLSLLGLLKARIKCPAQRIQWGLGKGRRMCCRLTCVTKSMCQQRSAERVWFGRKLINAVAAVEMRKQ